MKKSGNRPDNPPLTEHTVHIFLTYTRKYAGNLRGRFPEVSGESFIDKTSLCVNSINRAVGKNQLVYQICKKFTVQ